MLVDDRAGSKDLMKYRTIKEIATLTRLDSGDVAIAGNGPQGDVLVGVEVKSTWDVLSSANTGRLQATQVPAMLKTYDVSWLLQYGTYRPSPTDGSLQIRKKGKWTSFAIGSKYVPYGYIEALFFDLAALGVKVKHVSDMAEAAAWLGVLYRWWQKPWKAHKGMRTFDRSRDVTLMPSMDQDVYLRAKIAAQLPGVGFERAVAVANHFTSVVHMVTADEGEWAKVPGIGKVVARSAVRAMHNGVDSQ